MTERFSVSLLYSGPEGTFEDPVELTRGQTVADALAASERAAQIAATRGDLSFAVFGKQVSSDRVLVPGDRLELLRPLTVDPKEARRRRARC